MNCAARRVLAGGLGAMVCCAFPAQAEPSESEQPTAARTSHWLPLGSGKVVRGPLADPLAINFSVGVRAGDEVVQTNLIDASFGGEIPLYRTGVPQQWTALVALEAGVWFIPWTLPTEDGSRAQEFFSSDFYVGVPLTATFGRSWAARVRAYHISYHLGDEASVDHLQQVPRSKTLNALEGQAFWQLTAGLRLSGGAGAVVRSTGHNPGGPLYATAGVDYEFARHAVPLAAMKGSVYWAAFWRAWPVSDRSFSQTYAVGYQARPGGDRQLSVRAFVELNQGLSWVGRYSDSAVETIAVRLAFDQ